MENAVPGTAAEVRAGSPRRQLRHGERVVLCVPRKMEARIPCD